LTVSRAIGLKLFLEGQEIDVASADLSCGVNQQANCSIEIPTSDSVHKLLPRTLVHLFYFDTSHSTPFIPKYPDDVVGATEGSKVTGDVSRSRDIKTKEGAEGQFYTHGDMKKDFRYWKLLFVGEVLGYRYRNTTSGRSIILSCVDCSSYWSSAQLYWGGAKLSSSTYKRAIFVGAAQVHRGKSKVDSSGDLLRVLKRKPSSVNQIHGLLGGCISLLESASGVYGVGEYKKYRGVNDFMTVAELRLKLTRMIAAAPNDTTSEVFIKQKSFARYLRKLTRGLKATSSYMDLLGTLLSKCYYNYASVLAPPYFPDGVHEVWGDVKEPPKNDSPAPAGAKGRAKSGRSIMKQMSEAIWDTWTKCGQRVAKVNNTKGIATPYPNTTGIAKGVATPYPTGKDWVAYKGNTQLKRDLQSKLKGLISKAKSVGLHTEAGLVAARNEASKNATTDAKRKTASTLSIGFNYWYNAYQAAVELSNRPVDEHSEYLYRQVVKKIRWAIGKLGRGLGVYGTVVREKVTLRQTLHCFMFMPDIYMCPPPKCNVLFPNQVSSIEFDRSYLSEVTRLALHGRKASGRNLKTLYFAPNGDVLGDKESTKNLYQDALSAAKKSHSFLMKHEKYIGIIPSIMGLGDNEAHEKINAATEKQLKKLGKDEDTSPFQRNNSPSLSGAASSGKKQHMARAANYMFYSSRYDGRTMRLNCRFSPQLVPGQPCLVLDPNKNARSVVSVDADMQKVIDLEREMAKIKSDDTLAAALESNSSYQDLAAKLASAKNGVNSRLAKGKTKGTHYLGLIAGINHAFHASGGASTTVILSKARTHTEGVDIFGEPEDAGPRASAKQTVRHRAKYTYGSNQASGWWVQCNKGPGKVEKNAAGEFVNTYHPIRKPSKLYKQTNEATLSGPPSEGHWKIRTAKSTYKEGEDGLEEINGTWFAKVTVLKKGKLKEASRTSSKLGAKFSFEQTATPPWFSHIYHPDLIGENFYAVLNGCLSVLDGNLLRGVSDFDHLSGLGDTLKKAISSGEDLSGSPNMDHSEQIISNFSETDHYKTLFGKDSNGKEFLKKTLSDVKYTLPGPNDGEPINIPSSISTQQQTVFQAAEALTEIYLMMEENNLDTDRWVDSYTNRRFATMADIFGVPASSDSVTIGNKSGDYRKGTTKNEYHLRLRSNMALETMIDPNGKKYGEYDKGKFNSGFHTFAFGSVAPGTNLPGWEPLPMAGKPSKVKLREPDKFVDPRRTRWDRVHTYFEEIHMISTSNQKATKDDD